MRKFSLFMAFLMIFPLFSCSAFEIGESQTKSTFDVPLSENTYDNQMKAMWLSQFDLYEVYQKNGKQREKEDYKARLKKVIENVSDMGFDTVIVQLRPYADSIYPSKLYPPSRIAVGKYGNNFEYDPFSVLVDLAHKNSLKVQAWINPLRGMTEKEISLIPNEYKIKQWYDSGKPFISTYSDRLYLNPAYPEVIELISDGVSEIVANYSVDGVHMDDYFYPTTNPDFDVQAFAYADNKTDLATFRRNNISRLVKTIYEKIKKIRNIPFGISPAGNINSVYSEDMADIYLWCKEKGYIDYIAPQVYFGLRHQNWGFEKTCKMWNDIIKNPDITLYIGMSIGKAISKTDNYAGSGKNEWKEDKEILKRSLETTPKLPSCKGVIIFSYQYFYNASENTVNPEAKDEKEALINTMKTMNWNK